VLVPLESERTPTATDSAVRAEVSRYLAAFPEELPNRPDFDIRALNTNSPQNIDHLITTGRLDRDLSSKGKLSLLYNLSRMRERSFQFVAGMNPDTDIHAHRAQASYTVSPTPDMDVAAGFTFQRTRSLLVAEPNAVGTRARFGYQIQELGPDSEFPVDRALNTFRGGGQATRRLSGGRHTLTFGADLTRIQLNGSESRDENGYFYFSNNFGRTAIQNLLMGTPSFHGTTLGFIPRGFRNWSGNAFAGDRWQVNPRLQLSYGLRYSMLSRPVEVNDLDYLPYGCDCNNFGPRFGLSWQAGWGWVVRASYAISFGEIQPVTFQQVRINLPLVRYVQVQNPDFLNPQGHRSR
jgi:outer membrane receptor protein involved in Fe transport